MSGTSFAAAHVSGVVASVGTLHSTEMVDKLQDYMFSKVFVSILTLNEHFIKWAHKIQTSAKGTPNYLTQIPEKMERNV